MILKINTTELMIPETFDCLEQNKIEAIVSSGQNLDLRIIAANQNPKDKIVTIVTAAAHVLLFNAEKFFIPSGKFIPQDDGYKLFLPNDNRRWPIPNPGFYVDSSWILSESNSALSNAELFVMNRSLGKFSFL